MTIYPTATEALKASRETGGLALQLVDGRIVVAVGKVLDVLQGGGHVAYCYCEIVDGHGRARLVAIPIGN
jgi:hypothetical protein